MSRGLMIIPTCHPDPANLRRLCGLATDVELTPFVVWQGGLRDDMCVPGKWWPDPLGKGLAVKMALWDTSTGASAVRPAGALDRPWLVVDGDLTSIGTEPLSRALRYAESGRWARGQFESYGRLTWPLAELFLPLGYSRAGLAERMLMAHLWTSAVQAYPAGAMTPEELAALPDGYGWDVAAALRMEDNGRPGAPVPCGPKDHRQTDRAHLARVLGEVTRTLGEAAPAWFA